MNQEQFQAAVFAPAGTTSKCEALEALINREFDAIDKLPPGIERRKAHVATFLQFKDFLCGLAAPERLLAESGEVLDNTTRLQLELDLMRSGRARWQSLIKQYRHAERNRVHRRTWRPKLCGDYPFRDVDHGPCHVLDADDLSKPAKSGRTYSYVDVFPFTCPSTSKSGRAALYNDRLQVRSLVEQDLKTPDEQALIGQRGVFAKVRIAAGTCLGIYGGQLLDEFDVFVVIDDRYLLLASNEPGRVSVNGETMLSLVFFPARLLHGWVISVPALFATEDIAAGEELRWNYGLGSL
ncbi:MAG: hypothetical protein JF606_21750 [Burkholderiales bacterium]|nr:hypothetical protein [Burkholderiales bacterium]